jgi:3-hydroxyacyl-CoA dehydrogenase
MGDDIAIVSFKSRMHAIGDDVLQGVQQAIDEAERNYAGLVIWQTEPPFSVGANLKKTSGSGAKAPPARALGAGQACSRTSSGRPNRWR